ncbi:MAG: hypothetical protein IJT25_02640, partial [Clostridia bacterium]|nr:hypothetical protein [Clostridia bacterium]
YNFTVLKGAEISMPYGVLSLGYQSAPIITTKSGSETLSANDNSTHIKFVLDKTKTKDSVLMTLQFVANDYIIRYLPYEPNNKPETFPDGENVKLNGSDFPSEGELRLVWFDAKINDQNYISTSRVKMNGHDPLYWARSNNVILTDSGYNINPTTNVISSCYINEDFVTPDVITKTGEDAKFDVYMVWDVKKIYVQFYLNDDRSNNGSTRAYYKPEGKQSSDTSPISFDETTPYTYNDLYTEKINFGTDENPTFYRNGYKFVGFYGTGGAYLGTENLITATSKVTLTDAQLSDGIGSTSSNPLNLYAKWVPIEYKVRYYTSDLAVITERYATQLQDLDGNIKEVMQERVKEELRISSSTGSVETFVSSADIANYDSVNGYLEITIKFDSSIPYPSIVCSGYDLYGWFIKLPTDATISDKINLAPQGTSEKYYFSVASNGGTSLIWDFLDKSAGSNQDENYFVRIETRWRLQGVKVRLVTKFLSENITPEQILNLNEIDKRSGNSLDDSEKTRLKNLAKDKGNNSLLIYLLKDYNGADNGVVNNFNTKSAVVVNNDNQNVTVYYDIIIPYYASIGSEIEAYLANGNLTTLLAPTATGYNFKGYYYYNPTNNAFENKPRITANEQGGTCVVSSVSGENNFNLFQSSNTVPLVFYACWEIKEFDIKVSIKPDKNFLLEKSEKWYETTSQTNSSSSGYLAGSVLSISASYFETIAEDGTMKENNVNATKLNGIYSLQFKIKYYDTFTISIVMPDGHYLSEVNGQACAWNNSNGYYTSFVSNLNSNTSSENMGSPLGSYDKILFVEKKATANADYIVQENKLAGHSATAGKRDVSMTAEKCVSDYNLVLDFDRQTFKITVIQLRFNAAGEQQGENKIEKDGTIFMTDFKEEITAGPAYQIGEYYTSAQLTENAANILKNIVQNVTVYQKLIFSDAEKIEALFYGWGSGGYELIDTGYEYVYQVQQNNALYTNGHEVGGTTYKWTDSFEELSENDVRIIKFPVLTSFYWPTMVNGKSTGIRFAYWVRFGGAVNVVSPHGAVLTPHYITSVYGEETSDEKATYTTFCVANDPSSFSASFNGNDRFYAVFESVDIGFEIDAGSVEGTDENASTLAEDTSIQKLISFIPYNALSPENLYIVSDSKYSDYLQLRLKDSDVDIADIKLELFNIELGLDDLPLSDIDYNTALSFANFISYTFTPTQV